MIMKDKTREEKLKRFFEKHRKTFEKMSKHI